MRVTTTTLLSAIATTTLIPATLAEPAYIPYAWNETAPEVHNKPVNAHYGEFFIDLPTTAECPSYDPSCPSKNITIITGPSPRQSATELVDTFWMGVLLGGQQMYTDSHGGSYYTGPEEGVAIENVSYYSFAVELDDFSNQTVLRFEGNDWVGCPTEAGGLRVSALSYGGLAYADQTRPCFPFKMRLENTTAPAVRLYNITTAGT